MLDHNSTDPSQNYIERHPQLLDALFLPNTVAVIGAKDDAGSVGRTIMANLTDGTFKGHVYPINPKRDKVMGLKSYPSIGSVGKEIDLAVIVIPAAGVPNVISECVEAGVKTAIVISAGFKELGEEGIKLEQEMLANAKKGNMPIIGPNCLGVMNPVFGLNATFAKGMALPGNLAFISQSGAMCTAVLDWSLREKIGFSAFISIGSMADVNWGHLIDYFGDDPNTESLLLYMETIGDARSFLTAAREVALEKPIIVIKAGRSQAAANAAASHTGSLAGSDEVFDAALARVGVLRVDSISELFSMASVLARQPIPRGSNLTIITNAGGPAVLATDSVVANKADLTTLDSATIGKLNEFLPKAWSHSNPVDILGDANAERYRQTIDVILNDSKSDGILVILSPQDMTDSTGTASVLKNLVRDQDKPILASWMGGESVKHGIQILSEGQIPTFEYPDDAAKAFGTMWRYTQNLQSLYETPSLFENILDEDLHSNHRKENIQTLFERMLKEDRTLLTEYESKYILELYSIPVVETLVARNLEEAERYAEKMGYPIVLKLFSQSITHKSDVGGVKLNLNNLEDVVRAFNEIKTSFENHFTKMTFEGVTVQRMIKASGYELILGSSTDSQFGPVLLFGMGGQLVEVFNDSALGFPPLNKVLARHLMEKTKVYEALKGVRGRKPIDMDRLEDILIKFSQLVIENPRIKECDINPLLVSDSEMIALDARIVLHEKSIEDKNLPKPAIRPYPINYVTSSILSDGIPVVLRPIRPEDEPLMIQFHHDLSENTVRQRYFEFMSLSDRVAHHRLIRICFTDYDRDWAIVAECREGGKKRILGVGRISLITGTRRALIKLTVIDAFQYKGLGTKLMEQMLEIAKQEKIEGVDAYILSENDGMIKICKKLGFEIHENHTSNIVHAEWTR